MPRIVPRDFGTSLLFPRNGTTAKVTVKSGAILSGMDAFTISAWVKPDTLDGVRTVYSERAASGNDIIKLQVNTVSGGGGPLIVYRDDAGTLLQNGYGTSLRDQRWHYIVWTKSGTTHTVYQDGVQVGQTTNAATNTFTNAGIESRIGSDTPSPSETYSGLLDAVHIWPTALNATQIAGLYYNGITPAGSNGWWRFNEGTGTTALDDSGSGLTGTISGATYSLDVAYKLRRNANGNVVFNGDFETAPTSNVALVNTNKWIDGTATGSNGRNSYQWYNDGSGTIRSAMFDAANARTGGYAMKVSVGSTSSYEEVKQVPGGYDTPPGFGFDLQPSTVYQVSYWMKTNYVSGDSNDGAFLQFHTALQNGGASSEYNAGVKVKTTTGWTQYTFNVTTSANQVRGHVQLRVYGHTGAGNLALDAWFDDIVVRPLASVSRINGRDNRVSHEFTASNYAASAMSGSSAGQWNGTTQLQGSYGFWFKLTGTKANNYQLYYPGGDRMDVNYETNSNKLFVFAYLAPTNNQLVWKSTNSFIDGKWHHIVVNKTSTAIDVWIDGFKVGSLATTAFLNGLGSNPNMGNGPFRMSHLAQWARSLTDAEIQAFFMANTIPTANLVYYLPMSEATGVTFYDTTSGRNDNFTITGGANWSTDSYVRGRQPGSGNIVHNGNMENIPPAFLYGTAFTGSPNNNEVITGNSTGKEDAGNESIPFGPAKLRYSWKMVAYNTTAPKINYDLTVKNSGQASLRIEGGAVKERVQTMWTARVYGDLNNPYDITQHGIPILPNTTYDVSYWVKQNASNAVGSPTAGVFFSTNVHSNSGQVQQTNFNPPVPSGTFDWLQVTGSFTTPAAGRFLNLGFGIQGNGTQYYDGVAWFDDISITPRSTGRVLAG